MRELEDIPKDFTNPIITCINLMKCVVIFDVKKPFCQKYWRHLLMITSLALFYASVSMYMYEVLSGDLQLEEFAFAVSMYMVCTQAIMKITIVASKKKEIRAIIFNLGRMWRTEDLTEVQINKKNSLLKRLKFCYAAFYWMNVLGTLQYILAPLFETVLRKYILQQECDLLLPFPCRFPFDPTGTWPVYIGVYIFEIFSIFCVLYIYVGSEFLMITLCSHLTTEFTLLREDLLHTKPKLMETEFNSCLNINKEIKNIIKRHQKLIELSEQLDFIFNKMIFVDLSAASITICLFAFSATVARRGVDMANNFLGVAALAVPIFNLCYYGEALREASSGMADSAYHSSWSDGGNRYAKFIWFIIIRSQKSCGLTSLKYNPITLRTFTTVMSTTWSYFSLALNMYEEGR